MDHDAVQKIVEALDKVTLSVNILSFVVAAVFLSAFIALWARGFRHRARSRDVFKFDPDRAEELYNLGMLDKVIDYSKTCLDKYPNNVQALWYLGISQYGRGDLAEALGNFEKILKLDPAWKEPATPYVSEIREKLRVHESSRETH